MPEEVKSIGAAIEEFAEEETPEEKEDGTDVASADDDTSVEEGEAVSAEETETETEEGETEVPDLEDDDAWGQAPKEGEEEEGAEESEEESEEEAAPATEEEEEDIWEDLSAEDIKTLDSSPAHKKLKKALQRGYNKKMEGKAQLIKLGEAYEQDPIGVAKAIAQAVGLQVTETTAAPGAQTETADPNKAKLDKIAQARADVAGLFGEKVGPEVAEKLENFFTTLTEAVVAPLTNQVGEVTATHKQAQMLSEEAQWRQRHQDILTPEVETEVIALGNSGKFQPGDDMPPGEFLDVLTKVVLAEKGVTAKETKEVDASKKLAKRIEKNRQDREPRGVGGKSGVKKVSRLRANPEKFSVSSGLDEAARELHEGD